MTKTRLLAIAISAVAVSILGMAVVAKMRRHPGGEPTEGTAAPTSRVHTPYEVGETVYDGKFGSGWADWGWGPHEFANGGPMRIQFLGYGGIVMQHGELPSRFGALSFRFRAPASYGEFLEVSLKYKQTDVKVLPVVLVERDEIADLDDGWKEALIPWSLLNPSGTPFDRIVLKARFQVGSEWVSIDKVVLTKADVSDAAQGPAPIKPVHMTVACDRSSTPISPLIYGIAQGVWTTGETAHRVGGNAMTRLNWEQSAWNSASDWYFENVKSDSSLWDWIDEVREHQLKLAVLVPMIGWVAKDGTSVGFPVSKFGEQHGHDPNRPEAGDGQSPDGTPIRPGPPTLTSVEATPEVIRGWIQTLRQKDAAKGSRGVHMYILDNEPNLWNKTHRDVHPQPLTYDELLDRTIRYGTAIRQADPEAVIAGPAEWGWSGYFFSAKDTEIGALLKPDRMAHAGIPLLPWYLQKLAKHEKQTGVRILDVVDVHFYPQSAGVYGGGALTDPDTAALRIRSTRALWDPTYRDESWIKEHVNLIPMLKDWIERNYPGRGISLGEWSFGAEDHISGALAIAEALGRFGQQGITSAFYWSKLQPTSAGAAAFRAYRNFDHEGGRFLDFSVQTQAPEGTSLFASRDETGDHLVAVVLNLDPVFAMKPDLDVQSCGRVASRRVFTFDASKTDLTEERTSRDGGLPNDLLPPYSIRVIDMKMGPRAPH